MAYFSIIIPAFNRAHLITSVLNNVFKQNFNDFELILIDDGSTDNTRLVIQPYLSDNRVKYIYQNNRGVSEARNLGAKNASGNYLVFLDSDDSVECCWLKDFYTLLNGEDYDIAFCNLKEHNPDGSINWKDSLNPYGNSNKKGLYIAGVFALKRELFIKSGMYDPNLKFGENAELGIRLRSNGLKMCFVNKFNFTYNISPNGGSKNLKNKLDSNLYILDKHKDYFRANRNTKKLFMQVAGVSAARLGLYRQAHQLFRTALIENKRDIKLWLQFFLSSSRFLTKLKWKNESANL